jgi:hypothetical protein
LRALERQALKVCAAGEFGTLRAFGWCQFVVGVDFALESLECGTAGGLGAGSAIGCASPGFV